MKGFGLFTSDKKPTTSEHSEIVDFLFEQLDEYGDAKTEIKQCMDFALKESPHAMGGFILIQRDANAGISGATIVNKTGMSGYIPENILVYIAVHKNARGRGIGKQIMKKAIELAEGDIALHVEAHNPAKHLYESLGFTNKYLEMRYTK